MPVGSSTRCAEINPVGQRPNANRRDLGQNIVVCAAAWMVLGNGFVQAEPPATQAVSSATSTAATWAATDHLNRPVTLGGDLRFQVRAPRSDRQVAIFYYLWHGQHDAEVAHDLSQIIAAHPAALHDWKHPAWGAPGTFHFWGEPQFGFYRQPDRWILERHMQMLVDAGVDALFFDVTNGRTYDDVYLELLEVMSERAARGQPTMKVAFLTHSRSDRVVRRLVEVLYEPRRYAEHWFLWDGKPLMLADPDDISAADRERFTVRESWAWQPGQNQWPWLEAHPQTGGWSTDRNQVEFVSVSTASHPVNSQGKSYTNAQTPAPGTERTAEGLFFEDQWRRALELDPQVILVTQWNEWMAQRYQYGQDRVKNYAGREIQPGDPWFIDAYNAEYNRDIEPAKGFYRDAYYYHLVDGIRRFKGAPVPPTWNEIPAQIPADLAAWEQLAPAFADESHDAINRHSRGLADLRYEHDTGRNDFVSARLACDESDVAIYARTREPITAKVSGGATWMNVWLCVENPTPPPEETRSPDWSGFQFRVQNLQPAGNTMTLCRYGADGRWSAIAEVPVRVDGAYIEIRVPRKHLGLSATPSASGEPSYVRPAFGFKWSDHMVSDDPVDFWTYGDAAPNGRFRYHVGTAPTN